MIIVNYDEVNAVATAIDVAKDEMKQKLHEVKSRVESMVETAFVGVAGSAYRDAFTQYVIDAENALESNLSALSQRLRSTPAELTEWEQAKAGIA